MPRNSTVVLIRPAEKPPSGPRLNPAGQARAEAYVAYFQNYSVDGAPVYFSYLFAAADEPRSHRSRLTLEPLARALELPINLKFLDKNYERLAAELQEHASYDNCNVLVCWHHGEILPLAAALGVDPARLPATACWPVRWPEEVFGWLLQIRYDDSGAIDPARTFCVNQQLMYDDHGQAPPGPSMAS